VFCEKEYYCTYGYSPPIREEKQRGQGNSQLKLPPISNEIRDESHAHVAQIEGDMMQRANHGSPFPAHNFHGCDSLGQKK